MASDNKPPFISGCGVLLVFGLGLFCFSLCKQEAQHPSPTPQEEAKAKDLDARFERAANSRPEPKAEAPPNSQYRVVNGETNGVRGANWKRFQGKITQVLDTTILVHGFYGTLDEPALRYEEFDFAVVNFPYRMAENELISESSQMMAKESGLLTYTTVMGASRTIRKLDYGIPTFYRP